MTVRSTFCRTVIELRDCRQPIYSLELYADLIDRVQVARDAATAELSAPLVQTFTAVRDEGVSCARPCSFDPTLLAMIYAVEDDA